MSKLNVNRGSKRTMARWVIAASYAVIVFIAALGASKAMAANVGDELMLNGSFEQNTQLIPDHWDAMGGWGNPEISLSPNAAYSDDFGIKIETSQKTNPWIMQVVPFEEGGTYEVSAWLKATGVQGSGVGFKLEYYRGEDTSSSNHILDYDRTFILPPNQLTGDWQQFKVENIAPPEAGHVKVYVRLYGTGSVNFDDASFILKQHKAIIDMQTDEIFYYSDKTDGRIDAAFYPLDGVLNNKKAIARIYNEETNALFADSGLLNAENVFEFHFDPSQMSKTIPYRVEVQLLDQNNTMIAVEEEMIFRYDRPSMLDEDGTLIVDGEPFFPVAAYHAHMNDYPFLTSAGINAIQGSGTNNANTLQIELDTAAQYGLKMMVVLYSGMKVHENAAMTEEFVTRFKDHPAVLAWMIMDEPIHNGKTKEELINAYRIIKSIDSEHPVYMVEAPVEWAYETTAKLSDIFATDYYPLPDKSISLVGQHTMLGKQAAGEYKPVWTVLQAMYNSNHPYLPLIDEVRNMAYQSIINGAQGLAYYSMNEIGFEMRQSVLWPGLISFREELEEIGQLVTSADRLASGGDVSSELQWTLWQKDGELYVMAVNLSEQSNQATIPLGVSGYHAELIYGGTAASIDSGSNELLVQLHAEQAMMYRITPYPLLAEKMIDAAAQASLLSADAQWINKLTKLNDELSSLYAGLTADAPNMAQITKEALKALKTIEQLNKHVAKLQDQAVQDVLKAALLPIEQYLGMVSSYEQDVKLTLASGTISALEQNNLSVQIGHLANSPMKNIRIEVVFPEVFGLDPMTQTIAKLKQNESENRNFSFTINEPLAEGQYRLPVKIYYEYKGTEVWVEKSIYIKSVQELQALAIPGEVIVNKAGSYPIAIKLSNRSLSNMQVSLEAEPMVEGISLQLPAGTVVGASAQQLVDATLNIPAGIAEGEYTVVVHISRGERVVQSLQIPIKVSYNMLFNPGFEQATTGSNVPEGWLMRQGQRTTDEAHSGQYAVSLLPDGGANTYNVINSLGLMPVEAGHKYVLRGWVKNSASAGLVQIGLREIKADKIASVRYTWETVQVQSDWALYELEVVPDAASKYLQVYLSMNTHTDGAAWFDDFYVRELPL